MATIKLFHGSSNKIETPSYLLGKPNNDYGKGFYCTQDIEFAKEWACKQNSDGYVNEYNLDLDGLKILDLLNGEYNILNWIALLLKYRTFTIEDEIALDAKEYILKHYLIDLSNYDVVIGYRADDSYFSFAYSFVSNSLPLKGLTKALELGKLGTQFALISKKAFTQLKYISSEKVDGRAYFPKFSSRDSLARDTYKKVIKKQKSYKDDIFVMDILRQEIKEDDPRIQRMLHK